ncbi:MAG: hypothetical protein NW703_12935 [Nitrospiraceae bacterium]
MWAKVDRTMIWRWLLAGLCLWWALPLDATALEPQSVRPLRTDPLSKVEKLLPQETHVLIDAPAIEAFLEALDQSPPDWRILYGQGHHDPAFDERLLLFNRARDDRRAGREALNWRVAFVWAGQLTAYDPYSASFAVAIGPSVILTKWGLVRFKPDDLPGNLSAVPNPRTRATLRRKLEKGQTIDVLVVMSGKLIPEESIIYDFSHDEEGMGVVMPVVRIEQIDYLLP